jgi:hypothetical protein
MTARELHRFVGRLAFMLGFAALWLCLRGC